MKKIFQLKDPKKHEDRVLDSIKHQIRKYVNRENKKTLVDKSTMYWDFDCKIGANISEAKALPYEELIKELDAVKATGVSECYIEILAKSVLKPVKVEEKESTSDVLSDKVKLASE